MEKEYFPRRIPAMVTYLRPFRMVSSTSLEAWSVSIEQINTASWDYVKLHEIAGGLDVGLPAPYHMLVGRDGALALPPIPELRTDQKAVEYFNRCLAALLLGGIYCEDIRLDDFELGSIIDWKYIRSRPRTNGMNRFHELIRLRMAAPIVAIELLSPPTLEFTAIEKAAKVGFSVLYKAKQLSPELLLKGVSGIARRDWGVGLSNLWITVEQLTEALWQNEVLMPLRSPKSHIAGRIDQFKDARTWTIANRHELLHLKNIIDDKVLSDLYIARKARNELSHRGTHPSEESAKAAYGATLALLQSVVGPMEIPLSLLNLEDHSLSDPFMPQALRNITIDTVKYWLEIPKLPGEAELECEEAKMKTNLMHNLDGSSDRLNEEN